MPLKVLHLISNKAGIGGAEKLLLDMSDKYDKQRFLIKYCTIFSEGDNAFVKELQKRDLDCLEICGDGWSNIPQILKSLVAFMRREKFDIVHTQLLHASIIGHLAARLSGSPHHIITRQYTNDSYHKGNAYLQNLDARSARKASQVVAISKAVRNDLLKQRVSPDKIQIIPNGISLELFDGLHNNSLLRKTFPNKYLISFVGNLNHNKGHEYLLHAISRLISEFGNIHLFLIGEGELRSNLEKLTADLMLKNHVSFLGYRSNVPALLKEVDLYVHSSTNEALGIAILEAMAAEKCVIATNVGGIPEIIQDAQTGFLVPPRNAAAIAETIRRAIENPQMVAEIALRGRKRVEKDFTITSIAKRYQNLYEEVFKRSP